MTDSVPLPFSPPQMLLTIAIPTYNRDRYLYELLDVLFEQLIEESRVELIISDNASIDQTPAVIAEFQQRGLKLRSIRNEMNIGPDANFLQCFELARGRYFWLFGDDDIIVPRGIANILTLLEGMRYSMIYVNPYIFRKDYKTERRFDRFGRFAEVLPNGLALANKVGAMLTFISAVIIDKQRCNELIQFPLSRLVGTNLMQLGWVCPLLAAGDPVLIVWDPLVAGRGGNCGGWGACQVFGVNLLQVANAATENRSGVAAALCNRTLQFWFPDNIMEIRLGLSNDLLSENMRQILEPIYRWNWRYWFFVFPLISLPLPIARGWHMFLRGLTRVVRGLSTFSGLIFQRRNFISARHSQHRLVPGQ